MSDSIRRLIPSLCAVFEQSIVSFSSCEFQHAIIICAERVHCGNFVSALKLDVLSKFGSFILPVKI